MNPASFTAPAVSTGTSPSFFPARLYLITPTLWPSSTGAAMDSGSTSSLDVYKRQETVL